MPRLLPAWIFVALLAFALGAAPRAHAEDDTPDYDAETLILTEDDLPEGWSLLDDELAGVPTEDDIVGLGGDAVDTLSLTSEYRLVRAPSGAAIAICLVDVDLEDGPGAYTKPLQQAATEKGWSVKEIAHPSRVMVVIGEASARDQAVRWHLRLVAEKLGRLAWLRIKDDYAQGSPTKLAMDYAQQYMKAVKTLYPDAPMIGTVNGLVEIFGEKWSEGILTLSKSLAKGRELGGPVPLRALAYGKLGSTLLAHSEAEDAPRRAASALEKAVAMQREALAAAKGSPGLTMRAFGSRYDLACAYARLKDKSKAFEGLDKALELGSWIISNPQMFKNYFVHAWLGDEDWKDLRGEEKFMEVLKKRAPKDFDWEKEKAAFEKAKAAREKAEAERKKRAEEEKKKGDGGEKKDGDA